MRFRLQSAVEFMAVYGFAILIIAIMISFLALYISVPSNAIPPQCQFYSGFSCQDMVFASVSSSNSQIYVVATDADPGIINISHFNATVDFHNSTSGTCYPIEVSDGSKIQCIANFIFNPSAAQVYSGTYTIKANYCDSAISNFQSTNCSANSNYSFGGYFSVQASKASVNFVPITYRLVDSYTFACGVSSSSCTQNYYVPLPSSFVVIAIAGGGACYGTTPCNTVTGNNAINAPVVATGPTSCFGGLEGGYVTYHQTNLPYTGTAANPLYMYNCPNSAFGYHQISITNIGGTNGYYGGYAIGVYVFAPITNGAYNLYDPYPGQSGWYTPEEAISGFITPFSFTSQPGVITGPTYACLFSDFGFGSLSLNGIPIANSEIAVPTGQYGYDAATVDLQNSICSVSSINPANTAIAAGEMAIP